MPLLFSRMKFVCGTAAGRMHAFAAMIYEIYVLYIWD